MQRNKISKTSFIIFNIASIVENADETILPAVFFFISQSLNASIKDLGYLTLSRAAVQAIASPIAGIIGDTFDRTITISFGCVLWAIMTFLIGASTSVHQAMISCAFNGIGLALVIPSLSSVVADGFEPSYRGRAFGIMSFTSSFGGMLAAFAATNIGGMIVYGIEGWRLAFHIVAVISLITAACVRYIAKDPRHYNNNSNNNSSSSNNTIIDDTTTNHPSLSSSSMSSSPLYIETPPLPQPHTHPSHYINTNNNHINTNTSILHHARSLVSSISYILGIPSFQVIVLQGIVGSMPWQAMSLFTLYLQLLGLSTLSSSLLIVCFSFGTSLGGFIGGVLGDYAAVRSPHHGRIITAQVSVGSSIPLTLLLLKGIPFLCNSNNTITSSSGGGGGGGGLYFYVYAIVFFIFGTMISWCGTNNSAIFAEIVKEDLRTQIYAFDRSFEKALGACGAPLVGIIAQRLFGFDGSVAHALMEDVVRVESANALSSAMVVCLVIPWTMCFLIYFFLHRTYARDKLNVYRSDSMTKKMDQV